jgi:hypothetical protein
MSYQTPLSEWLDKVWATWETNFEKNERKIKLVFGASVILCPLFFGLMATGVAELMPLWVFGFAMSFYALVISGILLYRNQSRTEVNRRLSGLEENSKITNIILMAIAKKLGVDTDKIIEELKEDKNGKQTTNTTDNPDKPNSL